MTVYADDMQLPVKVGRHDSTWSHVFADTDAELHAFAAKLGLRREWFQEGKRPWLNHYDVTASKRQQAIRLGAAPVTFREAGQIIRASAQAASRPKGEACEHALPAHAHQRPDLPEPDDRDDAPATRRRVQKAGAYAKQHSWQKHDDYHRTCRDCGIRVLARPHPYERRRYQEYTTADGRCFVPDRVPPCEPAVQPQPTPDDEHGDLQRDARLIPDARALDPARTGLWDKREALIAASAPRPYRSTLPEPASHRRTCAASHPHQDAYLAARRSVEADSTGRCQDGHPVNDLRQDISARLIAAGLTASSPELARVRERDRRALDRAGIAPADEDKEAEAT